MTDTIISTGKFDSPPAQAVVRVACRRFLFLLDSQTINRLSVSWLPIAIGILASGVIGLPNDSEVSVAQTVEIYAAERAEPGEAIDSPSIVIESSIVKLIDSVDVPAELAGVLSQLNFREGQMVSAGDEIARINNDELTLKLIRAEIENRISRSAAQNDIDVRFAQKALDVSTARVNRSQLSNQRVPGVVPQARIEEQQLEVHRDRLRVEQAGRTQETAAMQVELSSTDVELSKLLKGKCSVHSPIDGMVVAVTAQAGEWVEPGEAIMKIVRLDRVKVEGYLPASAAGQIRIGDRASAKVRQDWLAGIEFPGKVMFINPEANPVNSNVQVWVEIENQDLKLIPGLESTLTIEFSPKGSK